MFEELLISGNEKETQNERIFMSNEKYISNELFLELLNSVKNAVLNNDVNLIKTLMKKYVDGFDYEK